MSNNTRLFLEPGISRHRVYSRRFRDLLDDFVRGCGGWDVISAAKSTLRRRATALSLEAEKIECALSKLDAPDPALSASYVTVTNALRRVVADIGVEKKPAGIVQDLARLCWPRPRNPNQRPFPSHWRASDGSSN